MEAAIETTSGARPAAAGVDLCDQEGCKEPAAYAYTWEWGAHGKCCAKHQFLLQQAAGNIDRKIQFNVLANQPAAPLSRDERVRLKAEKLAAEEELEEAKQRGLELYRQNTELTRQVQALTTRGRATEAQMRDLEFEASKLRTELGKRDAEHGDITDELGRLRALVSLPAEDHGRAQLEHLRSELLQRDATIRELEAVKAELEQRIVDDARVSAGLAPHRVEGGGG